MSYCRFSSGNKTYFEGTEHEFTPVKSDVYVYEDVGGYLSCCGCRLHGTSYATTARSEMIGHLNEHIAHGDVVPDFVMPTLLEETEQDEDDIDDN